MDKSKKLIWIDKILIFVFLSIILTLYYFCNVYIINLSNVVITIDIPVLITLSIIYFIATFNCDYYDDKITLKEYQIYKIIFAFVIVLNSILLFNYSANHKDAYSVIIFTIIYFALILFIHIIKFSPILNKLRIKANDKNIRKEQFNKLN